MTTAERLLAALPWPSRVSGKAMDLSWAIEHGIVCAHTFIVASPVAMIPDPSHVDVFDGHVKVASLRRDACRCEGTS